MFLHLEPVDPLAGRAFSDIYSYFQVALERTLPPGLEVRSRFCGSRPTRRRAHVTDNESRRPRVREELQVSRA